MNLPLDTTLCLIAAIPAGICLAQGKDGATKAWCGALLAATLIVGLRHYVGFIDQYLNGNALKALSVSSGILAIIAAVRSQHAIFGTLMVTGGVLLALLSLGIVG
jgi:hypothetical protein